MARRKTTLTQRDFSLGAPRPEAAERDDTALVQEGLREAQNTIVLSTGAIEQRPGTVHMGTALSNHGVEVDLGRGRVYDVHVISTGVKVYDSTGAEEASFTSTTWDSLSGKYGTDTFDDVVFWVTPDPDTSSILIGAYPYPTHVLTVDESGTWSFGALAFAADGGGRSLQPFWSYYPDVSLTPSARTGSITVTASSPIFSTAWEGMKIRWGGYQITLDTFSSTTVMNATANELLPNTLDITLSSTANYRIGDAVEHSTAGGQGIITGIAGSVVTVLTTARWDSFPVSGSLVAPNASQTISAVATATPAASKLWDMQMGNKVFGYPGWGVKHKGRSYLARYPGAPNGFAVSVAGNVADYSDGVDDGDGFVESIGADKGGDLLYIISAEDLLFFTTRGLYYQQTRNQEDVTPTTIGPVQFSSIGAASVVPVAVDDGAIFVDSVGQQVQAAVLAGDVYRSWRVEHVSQFHNHLLTGPVYLGSTQFGSERPEQYVYVTNADGTAAVAQWDRAQNKIGWRPWVTDGRFLSIYQAFGSMYAVVDRDRSGFTGQFREKFVTGVYMDCVAGLSVDTSNRYGQTGVSWIGGTTKLAPHLHDLTVAVYMEGWDLGDRSLNATGEVLDDDGVTKLQYPDYTGTVQVGLPFAVRMVPWARRYADYQRSTRDIKATTHVFVTCQDTLAYKFNGRDWGGYRIGDDVSVPPALRSEETKFIVGRGTQYEEYVLETVRPGPMRILKLRYRVVV